MKRHFIFILIAFLICPISLRAQEMSFFAGQIESTFNFQYYPGSVGGPPLDTLDFNADGIDDIIFTYDGEWNGHYGWMIGYIRPLNDVAIIAKDAYHAQDLSYGDTIFPVSVFWAKNTLPCWLWQYWGGGSGQFTWYLDDGYLAFRIPVDNDTLYGWLLYDETERWPESYTCWKQCNKFLDIVDSVQALLQDTIYIDAGPGYDSIYWSTGDTGPLIELICSEWGAGEWEVSLVATDGGCQYYDTAYILIEDESGIPALPEKQLRLGPNPFYDNLGIWNPYNTELRFDIVNMLGKTVLTTHILSGNNSISLGWLEPGIYMGSFYHSGQRTVVKMIKR